jgi:hypothetical protein
MRLPPRSASPARGVEPTGREIGSVAVRPGGDIDLVALCIGERPPPRRMLVIDDVATSGKRGYDARLGLIVRDVDVDMDPIPLGARRIHLLEPDRRSLERGSITSSSSICR